MAKKIFVGNLAYNINNDDLRLIFVPYGKVMSAEIMTEKDTGRSRGFGFVVMANDEQTAIAIENAHGKLMGKRELVVNEAQAVENRRPMRPGSRKNTGETGIGSGWRGRNEEIAKTQANENIESTTQNMNTNTETNTEQPVEIAPDAPKTVKAPSENVKNHPRNTGPKRSENAPRGAKSYGGNNNRTMPRTNNRGRSR